MIKVLLVEDEASMVTILQNTLNSQGFEVSVAYNGVEGLRKVQETKPDVLVVDIMMPEMDGFEMVRHLRASGYNAPVLFLTARSAINDIVEGFEIGGDDYLKKPFNIVELILRIKALYARYHHTHHIANEETDNMVQVGQYMFDPTKQMLSRYGNSEELSHRETQLLQLLLSARNTVVATHDILESLWGNDNIYNINSLQVFITKLRRHLAKDPNIKIVNARGIGYKLIVP